MVPEVFGSKFGVLSTTVENFSKAISATTLS
jgi:hypothetical protein